MAAINIQSLFADIIDTPEQRQMKMLQEGMLRGDRLASGLTGLTRAAAPLAQVAGQLGVQRQENLRRAVQPMLGIDPRTTGEKLQDQLRNIDTSTPKGLMQAAQAVQQIDPVRAAALRQAATEQTQANEDRDRRIRIETMQIEAAERAAKDEKDQIAIRKANAEKYRLLGMPEADINGYITGSISPLDMAKLHADYVTSRASKQRIASISPFTGKTDQLADEYISNSKAAQDLLKEKKPNTGFFGSNIFAEDKFTEQMIKDEAAVIRAYSNNEMLYDEAIDRAVQSLRDGGFRNQTNLDSESVRLINTQLGYSNQDPNNTGEVNLARTNAGTEEGDSGLQLAFDLDIARKADNALNILEARLGRAPQSESSANLNATDPSMPMSNAAYLSNAFERFGNMFKGQPQAEQTSFGQAVSNTFSNYPLKPVVDSMMVNKDQVMPVTQGISGLDQIVNTTTQSSPVFGSPQTVAPSQVSALDQIVTTARQISATEVPEDASPADKRNAATFNDYVSAVEKLNFPVLPQLAKKIKNVPAISAAMVKTFEGITRTLNSSEQIRSAVDEGFNNILNSTATVVGSLVRAQSNTREDGEEVLQLIEKAQANIKEMNKQLGKVPPAVRKDINAASNALLDLVIEYKKRYNLPTPR